MLFASLTSRVDERIGTGVGRSLACLKVHRYEKEKIMCFHNLLVFRVLGAGGVRAPVDGSGPANPLFWLISGVMALRAFFLTFFRFGMGRQKKFCGWVCSLVGKKKGL
ncbi:hypothetical protein CEXT_120431 [Caerostris extrusa]|uniref:Transmembrane protein n=1 Tax=Caerostris extrusa TaxID=172846 RepID=A0AAV4VT73_CAEEX|nr:hypothetical protein CEXT_120431 [Caerostris extrusa]